MPLKNRTSLCDRSNFTSIHILLYFSSRRTIYSAISNLVNKTDEFQKMSTSKYAKDKNWIEKKLKEGKWEQIRDISKKRPAKDAEPETPMSLLSPKRPIEEDSGKGKRIKFPNPKYMDSASPVAFEQVNFDIPATLNFDHLGLEDNINDDEDFEPEKKKEPKKKKVRLEETILAGERCGLNDFQIAMMYNAGSM